VTNITVVRQEFEEDGEKALEAARQRLQPASA
jgi:hypothetical protein